MSMVAALKRANAPVSPEDSPAVRISVLVAVLAAAASVVQAGIGSPALQVGVLVAIPAGFLISHVTRHRPRYVRKGVVALVALGAFGHFVSAALGVPVYGLAQLRVPLAELFLTVQAAHSFDLPARRDLMVSLLSSLALIMVGGAISTSLEFSAYLVVWAVAALTSLVLAHRQELAALPLRLPPAAPARRGPGAGGRRLPPVARLVLSITGVVAMVGAVAVATLVLMPPSGSARVLPLPSQAEAIAIPNPGGLWNPSLGDRLPSAAEPSGRAAPARFGYFGFSSQLDTAARGRPDNTPVMRVRAAKPDFWRGQTFDVWDGRRWTISDSRPAIVGGSGILDVPPSREDRYPQFLGQPFVQTYFLQQSGPNVFFSAYKADRIQAAVGSAFVLSDGTIRAPVEMRKGTVYSVVSRRRLATAETLRSAPTDAPEVSPQFVARYTQLPPVVPERVKALAAEVTAGAPTVYDKVRALERWMGENTAYTLAIPPLPPGADAVDQFLFVDRRGFCEQIGSSLVVMLRSLGVPARLAVGYTPGARDPFTGLWQVRASDAHAWAEVYFPGVGWQGFDPTAAVPLAGEAELPSTASALVAFIKDRLPSPAGAAPVVAAAAMVSAIGLARRLRARRLTTVAGGNGDRWVDQFLRRLERIGRRIGVAPVPEETVREYVRRLQPTAAPGIELGRIVPIVEAEQFSGERSPDDVRRTAEKILESAYPSGR